MPLELIEAGFESLAQDKSFSQKMRDKFKAVLTSPTELTRAWCSLNTLKPPA